ncbi:MAG: hypothetical protein QOH41_213 [Blastocatellia bacterium]|jgi:hypothetical protein|nr:hypothetical protein [Blastocatellia bacterium]
MNTKQTNRVTMFDTVTAYLDSHNPVWNGTAPLVDAVTAFKNKIGAIATATQQQETPSGATDSKGEARDDLEDVLFLTCEALAVLGHTNNDHELLAVTALTPSTLDRMPDDELITRATLVLERANSRKAELATLHVTQANLDELTQALSKFSALKTQPRTTTAERAAQTQSLESLIRDANGILRNQIDRMVNLFSRSDAEFVAGYRSARVVVDRAATHSTKPVASPPPPSNP